MKTKKSTVILLFIGFLAAFPSRSYGQVSREVWYGRTLADPQSLANSPDMFGAPTSVESLGDYFEAPLNLSGTFVARHMAKFTAPISATVYFWIAANEKASLWISATGPSFSGRTPIAKITTCTPLYRQWTRCAEQRSTPISLVGGRTYWLMMIQAENSGDGINHASVGWYVPNTGYERPMYASNLSPSGYPANISLSASPQSVTYENQPITLTWQSLNVSSCSASSSSGDPAWLGLKPRTGSQQTTSMLTTSYGLTCLPLDGTAGVTSSVSVTNNVYTAFQIAWDHVTQRNDGTPLTNRGGYRVLAGTTSGSYNVIWDVGNINYMNLTSSYFSGTGTYYFVVIAYDTEGRASSYSSEVSTFVWVPVP